MSQLHGKVPNKNKENLTDEGWRHTRIYGWRKNRDSLDSASGRLLLGALYSGEGWDDRRQKLKSKHPT